MVGTSDFVGILKGYLVSVGQIDELDRILPEPIPRQQFLGVALGLSNQFWSVESDFTSLGFEHGGNFAVEHQNVVGLVLSLEKKFTNRHCWHPGAIFVTVDNQPTAFLKLVVNPYSGELFWLHFFLQRGLLFSFLSFQARSSGA